MSVTGIGSSSLFQSYNTQNAQNRFQQFKSEFQQLGQDLQAGDLTKAQSDFATLTQNSPAGQQNSNSPLAQAFSTLANDLQSGNVTAAQQDYSAIQQIFQQGTAQTSHHHHHHHHHSGGSHSASSQQNDPIAQAFAALGQALQSGNLSSAQQAYATLQQDFAQLAQSGSTSASSGTAPVSAGASLNATA